MLINFILIISIIFLAVISLIVLLNNPRATQNKLLFCVVISGALWVFANLLANLSTNPSVFLLYARLTILPAALVVYFFILFSYSFPYNKKVKFHYYILYAIPVLPFFIFVNSTQNINLGNTGSLDIGTGNLYYYVIFYYLFYSLIGFKQLIKSKNNSNNIKRIQINYVIIGVLLSFLFGLAINGIGLLLRISSPSQIGSASVLFFVVLSSIALVRHKLFDIRAVVARSVAFILSIVLVGLIYGFISFRLVAPFVQNISQSSRYAVFTIIAVIIAFTFAPLRRLFEKLTDKIFYRDKYDPQELISEIGHILSSEIRLDILDRKVTAELTNKMKVSRAYIVVLDKGKIYYQRGGGEFDIKDLMHLGKSMIVADDLATESERKKIFDKYNIGISTVLKTKEDLVGFLLVGGKKSGDIFSTQDTRVIRIVSNELAVAIQNAKAYEQIRRFNETLKAKIAEATKQLASANEHLKELDKAKDEFISMASHQLRTPLTTVKGYLSMLDEGDFGKLNKEQRDSIKLAFDGADRMAGLIGDLLNISRMEAGRFFIDAHSLDLNAIIKNEVDQLQFRANSMGVKLSLKVGKIVPQISLDEDKMRQVIMNLIDNAIHYSPKGEVRVEFGLEGDEAVLKVIDNGIGVSEKDQKSLFSKFFRAGNAQKTRPDGTGLGLFLVKRVVEDQGGKIIFESEVGKGSTFGFRLPVKK